MKQKIVIFQGNMISAGFRRHMKSTRFRGQRTGCFYYYCMTGFQSHRSWIRKQNNQKL